ncbi:cell division protein ZipA [Amphritea pacifica]|uniref:Cell division protein ZipA n=1 Tax=Amphritea pacifica TaxID=2811233 RepID=A0ABS2W5G0_9GAMM|nr:cell division protein ZipA [Amphritea pacifica]MBN0986861.1 cell division protein ZipA [Amphritea pacifica]
MELGLREWLIIGGAIVVLLIVLDGWRRMRGGGNRLKMKIDKSFNDIPDVPEETFNPELPGGGARVVGRASDSAADTRREPVFGNAELGDEGLELSIAKAARSAAEKPESRKPLSQNKPDQSSASSSPATESSAAPGRFAKPAWMNKSVQGRSEHISPTFSEDEHDPLFASSDSFPPHHDGPSFDDMDEGISAVRVVRTPKPSEKNNEHPADKTSDNSPQDGAADEDIPVVQHIVTQQERGADAKTGSESGRISAYSSAEPELFRPENLVPENLESDSPESESLEPAYPGSAQIEDDNPEAAHFEKGLTDSARLESEGTELESSELESSELQNLETENSEPEIAQPENVELFPADESDRKAVPANSQLSASYSAEDDDLIDSLPEGFRTDRVAESDDDDDESEFDYTRPVSELMRPVCEDNSQLQQTSMDLQERQESIFSLIDEPAVESEPPFEKSGLARVKAALKPKPKPAPQPERFSAIDDEPEEIADGFFGDQSSARTPDITAAKPVNTADTPNSGIGIKGQSLQKIPEADKVLVISVVAAEGQNGFSGRSLLQILLACGMRYGDMKIFHRYEDGLDKGAIQFSMTNALEPGYFDIDTMDSMETRGVTFFMSMEEPRDVMNAYECMLATAIAVAKNLHGVLLDENRSTMRDQTKEHYRERIRKFEMRKLKKTTSA